MKLQEIFEAKYYRSGDDKVPFEEPIRSWAIKMWQALQNDWYNSDGDWEWFVEFGLENPTNTIEKLWNEVPDDLFDQYESAFEWALHQVKLEAHDDPDSLQAKQDQDYVPFGECIEEGFREKALAAIATAGLAFGSAAKADPPDLYAYTDDAGETQVVLDYQDVPKGKMARLVKYEDVFGRMDIEDIRKEVRKEWKTRDLAYRDPKPFRAGTDRLSKQMVRKDI